jgi:hypothetical protein
MAFLQFQNAIARVFICARIRSFALSYTTREMLRERTFFSVENFSQHTAFWSCAMTHSVKIERIGEK